MDPQKALAKSGRADVLAVGFGTTVAMWGVGYVCRMPPAAVPSWVLLGLLLVCLFGGGFVAGRYTSWGWLGGVQIGLLAGVLNLLILGSLLGREPANRVVPPALFWMAGWFLTAGGLGGVGAIVGSSLSGSARARVNWTAAFATVAAVAALMLVTIGAMVTSKQAGLSVADWPNTFGHNMFLYPLSRMTGGIYYEHVHRLCGSLVGLTTIVLAIHLWRVDRRRWLKKLAAVAVVAVIVQGVLGGLRVTGHFTLSMSQADMAPSIALAILHGVVGQLFFVLLVGLAVFTSSLWISDRGPARKDAAGTDRWLTVLLPALLVVQLILGAILRHRYAAMVIHVTMAVLVVVVVLGVGLRSWGLYEESTVRRLGVGLIFLTGLQVLLGIAALIATGATAFVRPPPTPEVALATAHQALGAVLLAWAVMLALWHRRLFVPAS